MISEKPLLKVTCGIIFNDEGKVFICRRKPEKSQGGYWEFPGGKVEEGESLEECLRRELLEELDMDVQVIEHFKTVQHDYGTIHVELIAFTCQFLRSSYKLEDHDLTEWVDVFKICDKDLAPADLPIGKCLASKKLIKIIGRKNGRFNI
ncbi:(deoxy)nucleoside triphosphate pyrophosphohydrolase [Vibrio fluvialis]|nr:(deoxy)nucleoside triphosphate pyrophosphohydrolase [Vibrio fluvialis]